MQPSRVPQANKVINPLAIASRCSRRRAGRGQVLAGKKKPALTISAGFWSHTHLWNSSAVAAIDKVVFRLRRGGHQVELMGLKHASPTIIDRLALHDKEGVVEAEAAH